MKTALLMFGQPRYVQESFTNIHRCLIEPNNADVYVHTWIYPTDQPFRVGEGWKNERLKPNATQDIENLYKPKAITKTVWEPFNLINEINFSHSLSSGYAGGAENQEIANYYVEASLSMWYSVHKCFSLLEKKYDAIILTRFDLGIQTPIYLQTYDLNAIWGEDIGKPELLLNWMNFGSETHMRHVFKYMFTELFKIYAKTNIWCNEYWCRFMCEHMEIPIKRGSWGLTIPSRNL